MILIDISRRFNGNFGGLWEINRYNVYIPVLCTVAGLALKEFFG